jgi:hypothetical protein
MGTMLNAICKNCGFTNGNIYFGSGMMNRTPKVPAIRRDTGEFVVAELSDDPNLHFYHHREMYKEPIEGYGIQNFDISLNPTSNLCPSCGEFAMDFDAFGSFD